MSDGKSNSLYDLEENGQQILPFDFPEDDDSPEKETTEKSPSKLDSETSSVAPQKKQQDKSPNSTMDESNSDKVSEVKKILEPPAPIIDADKTDKRKKTVESTQPVVRRLSSAQKKGNPPKTLNTTFPASQILREARVRAGLTTEQASQITKIKCAFIEALENDDESNTPPKVFVTAYIKQLCKLYKVDPQPVLKGFEQKSFPNKARNKVPEEILQDVDNGKQINMREEERLKKILKIALLIIGIVILLILTMKIAFNKKNNQPVITETANVAKNKNEAQSQPATSLKTEDLEVFMIDQPTLTMTTLKVPDNDE